MLQLNNSYARSFVSIDEQLQSGLLPQSVGLELLACMSLACSLSKVFQLLIMSVPITVFCEVTWQGQAVTAPLGRDGLCLPNYRRDRKRHDAHTRHLSVKRLLTRCPVHKAGQRAAGTLSVGLVERSYGSVSAHCQGSTALLVCAAHVCRQRTAQSSVQRATCTVTSARSWHQSVRRCYFSSVKTLNTLARDCFHSH